VKSLAVIHDLNFEHYPQDIPFIARKYYVKYFPVFAERSCRVATVSEYSKQDISRCYNIPPEKIDVVYDGANEIFKPVSQEEKRKAKIKYTRGEDYFLFIGALHPRKNIVRLLQAFDAFKADVSSDIKLLIVGEKMWKTAEIDFTLSGMRFKRDVIFTGRLHQEELKNVTASAFALVFVPYFEGFGIPIVEAMNCDVPVITSNVTSMPEVAGNAGLLVDPFSVNSIKEGMLKIYKDDNLRIQLIASGRIQREKFSWNKTAEKLWKCIERTF
jgi:glycosyltransferase involved in cell wall biosynthesis